MKWGWGMTWEMRTCRLNAQAPERIRLGTYSTITRVQGPRNEVKSQFRLRIREDPDPLSILHQRVVLPLWEMENIMSASGITVHCSRPHSHRSIEPVPNEKDRPRYTDVSYGRVLFFRGTIHQRTHVALLLFSG